MKIVLIGGEADGQTIEIPEPPPPYIVVNVEPDRERKAVDSGKHPAETYPMKIAEYEIILVHVQERIYIGIPPRSDTHHWLKSLLDHYETKGK